MGSEQNIEIRRKRLKFRCWHRGTKEADLLLGGFADAHIDELDEAELDQLEDILAHNDIDLYNWIGGYSPWPANVANDMTERLTQFCAEGGHR
ncbi:MAG: succinate dehydrogenase assembly factor 2 family protein [Rhodospirillaceae bacterium]|nr:succinate dehydrogenase assembly factor 2 family protein [Rhodospirillaceae bacterium]HAA94036.1 succinate dehydrogenase assembly factor 2 family protein [Rhodospirillaceae bacterium]|tara:strand:+ start:221 stop:499 length:279 start_codon:yes stop_codon:yes gene_type:complete